MGGTELCFVLSRNLNILDEGYSNNFLAGMCRPGFQKVGSLELIFCLETWGLGNKFSFKFVSLELKICKNWDLKCIFFNQKNRIGVTGAGKRL